jgi:cytochrome c oxidase subunit 2
MNGPARRRALARLLGASSALALGPLTLRLAAAQAAREIAVVARRFTFTPNEIPLRAGERVVLAMRALDFAHGFSVPDLALRADLMPERVVRVELLVPRPGRYGFLCDNFCGDEHEDMNGWLVVTE